MIIRRIGLAIGVAALMFSGLTAGPAMAKPAGPVTPAAIAGCYGGVLDGHRAWYRCGGSEIRKYHKEFRVWAGCVGGKTVYGPWKLTNYSQSIAPGCSRGIQNAGGRYSYNLR